jgi:transcriptional regulator with XRE-family HTH domain/uncharacterized glyoxalase superfamily protein PhnB
MVIDYGSSLSKQISLLRKQNGYTQEQLAAKLGVTYQAVSKWENGQSCPDIMLLPAMAEAFGVTLDELFGRSMIDLKQGLVAHYRLDGNAQDSSGNERDGTVSGAVPCADRFGSQGGAMRFDGVDDYIVIDPAPRLQPDGFTLSVWCCYDDHSQSEGWCHAIVSQDGHHQRRVFQLSTYDSSITFHRFLTEPDLYVDSPLRTAHWYHIVVTYEARQFRLYKNGELISEAEGSFAIANDEPLFIGRKSTDEPYFYYRGMIDDIRLYDRALREGEVIALFRENGWSPVPEPDLPKQEARALPVLDSVEDVLMPISVQQIDAAAAWYKEHLGFKPLMEQEREFYLMTLYKGPNLLLQGAQETDSSEYAGTAAAQQARFHFKTRRELEPLKEALTAAGASEAEIRDAGFAWFLTLRDPFGHGWAIMREYR